MNEVVTLVPVWFQRLNVCVFIFGVFLFFFFSPHLLTFQRQNSLFMNSACTVLTHYTCIIHAFKNGSHGIIHTFKNYFSTVFSVFSFQMYPNGPLDQIRIDFYHVSKKKKNMFQRSCLSEGEANFQVPLLFCSSESGFCFKEIIFQ